MWLQVEGLRAGIWRLGSGHCVTDVSLRECLRAAGRHPGAVLRGAVGSDREAAGSCSILWELKFTCLEIMWP